MKRDYVNIGGRLPRVDGMVKAAGEAMYTGDLSLPGMLHGKLLRSPHPHARLLKIDTAAALALEGVRAVITGADTLKFLAGGIASPGNEPYLAFEKVRFVGDAVAAVDEANRTFDAETTVRVLEDERITFLQIVPTQLVSILDTAEAIRPDLSALTRILYAASPMPVDLLRRGLEKFGPIFVQSYGQSEAGPNITSFPRSEHDVLDLPPERQEVLRSAGRPCVGVQVKIVDEERREVPLARRARSPFAASRSWSDTGGNPRRPRRRSSTAGFTPATWAASTPTATCTLSTARRT